MAQIIEIIEAIFALIGLGTVLYAVLVVKNMGKV